MGIGGIITNRGAQILIAPHFALRQAGLSVRSIGALGKLKASGMADMLKQQEILLKEITETLCDEIFNLIRYDAGTDIDRTRRLLRLKRNIYNQISCDLEFAQKNLPPDLFELLKKWRVRGEAAEDLLRLAESLYVKSMANSYVDFRGIFQKAHVQTAICYAQPELFKRLCILPEYEKFTKKDHQALLSGIAYLYRMATKTSPFSYFTTTGIGFLPSCNAQKSEVPDNNMNTSIEDINCLNIGVLRKIYSALLFSDEYIGYFPLLWNPAAICIGLEYFVLYQDRGEENDEVIPTESIAIIPCNTIFPIIEALFSSKKKALEKNQLSVILSETLCIDPHQATRLIDKMIGLNLLIPSLDFDENTLYGIKSLMESKFVQKLPVKIVRQIGILDENLDALNEASPIEKIRLLDILAKNTQLLLEYLDVKEVKIVPQKIVHNSTYFADVPGVNADIIEDKKPFFEPLLTILPLFNTDFSLQQWIKSKFDVFLAATKKEPSTIAFFTHLCYDTPGENNLLLNPKAISQMETTRHQEQQQSLFIDELSTSLKGCLDEFCLGHSFLAKWGNIAEQFHTSPLPLSMTVLGQFQEMDSGTNKRFILNKVFAGYGTMFTEPSLKSRKRNADKYFTDYLKSINPDVHFADLLATMAFQGQIRPKLSGKSLYYPGQQICYDADKYFDWNNLIVSRGDNDCIYLLDVATDTPVIPLHRGTLANIYFPPFYKFLSVFGPAFTPDFSLFERLLAQDIRRTERTLIYYPRIVSDGVVVMRKAWSIPLSLVPKRSSAMNEFAYYRVLRQWANELSIPKEVFVIPVRAEDYWRSDFKSHSFKRIRKPFYLNFDDQISFCLFLRYLSFDYDSHISFIEALPGFANNNGKEEYRVQEYQFEIYQRKR